MGQVIQDMTKDNCAVNTRSMKHTDLGVCIQKVLPLQNPSSGIFSVQKPNVILASEEAAELEILSTPKQMPAGNGTAKTQKGRVLAWKPPGSGKQELGWVTLGWNV